AAEKRLAHERASAAEVGSGPGLGGKTPTLVVALAWGAVGIPLAWGVYKTLLSAAKFFN
ncbi:MAG: MFS transporter, partial [Rhizobacter sp.]|nr:MFS transporter [Rhizobacter sp.]